MLPELPELKTQGNSLESYKQLQKYINRLSIILTRRVKNPESITLEQIDALAKSILRRVIHVIYKTEGVIPSFGIDIRQGNQTLNSFEKILQTAVKVSSEVTYNKNPLGPPSGNTTIPIHNTDSLEFYITLPGQGGNNSTPLLELTLSHIIGILEGFYYSLEEKEKSVNKARREVITDPLTGGLRRGVLGYEEFTRPFDRAREEGENFAVYILDLDRFKPINDTYGHHIGDEVLKLTVERILSIFPGSIKGIRGLGKDYMLYRAGGDEFVLYVKGTDEDFSDTLKQAISADIILTRNKTTGSWEIATDTIGHLSPETKTINVGVSIGRADTSDSNTDISTMMKQADQRMYANKPKDQVLKRLKKLIRKLLHKSGQR